MAFIFKTPHDWAGAFELETEFNTDIFESYNGIETRRAQRFWPRRKFRFRALEANSDMRDFMAYVAGGQDEIVYVPNPVFRTELSAPAAIGDSEITVTQVRANMLPGGAVIMRSGEQTIRLDIVSVSGNTITVDNTLAENWPIGAKVYESVSCYLTESLSVSRLTSTVAQGSVEFNEFPGRNPQAPPTSPPVGHNGLPLFDRQPDWADSPSIQFVAQRQEVDYGKGAIDFNDPRRFAHQITQFGHTGKTETDAEAFMNFHHSQRGRAGEFYLPSWSHDMELADTFASGSFLIEMKGQRIALHLNDEMHRNIWIRLKNGTNIPMRVNAAVLLGENSVLSLDSTLGFAIDPDEVLMISWLYLARFSADRLVYQFLTSGVMDTTASFTSLRES